MTTAPARSLPHAGRACAVARPSTTRYEMRAPRWRREADRVAEAAAVYAPTPTPVDDDRPSLAAAVAGLRAALDAHDEDLDRQDTDALRARIDLLRQVEGLTAAAMATAVGALSRAGGVTEDGASSTTAWVAETTGRTRHEAARVARLGTNLVNMPKTAAALAGGDIGVATADVIVQATRDGRLGTPAEVEARLLPLADEGPERLRAHVRRLTQQVDGAEMLRDEQRQHQRRGFSLSQLDDGMWRPDGMLTAEVGTKLWTLLNAVNQRDPAGTSDEDRRSHQQRMADALEVVTDLALGLGDLPATGGVARPHVSVLVDITTFQTDLSDPEHPDRPVPPDDPVWATLPGVETETAGTLSPQTGRKICCDAGISRIVMAGESQVLDVGRETRVWSASQRRAINARDRSCRGPGCGRPIGWTQIHHLQWWRHGGRTDVDNGLAVCSALPRPGPPRRMARRARRRHRGGHLDLARPTADGRHPPATTDLIRVPRRGGAAGPCRRVEPAPPGACRDLRSLRTEQSDVPGPPPAGRVPVQRPGAAPATPRRRRTVRRSGSTTGTTIATTT